MKRAGWYADPERRPDLRWWDGRQWTDWVCGADTVVRTGTPLERPRPGPGGAPPGLYALAIVGVAALGSVLVGALAFLTMLGQESASVARYHRQLDELATAARLLFGVGVAALLYGWVDVTRSGWASPGVVAGLLVSAGLWVLYTLCFFGMLV